MKNSISLYVHWPFCETKCPYCDFNSHVSDNIDSETWKLSFLKELNFMVNNYLPLNFKNGKLISIFFGGGTPSIMHYSIAESIINFCNKKFIFSDNIEITMEANPKSTFKSVLKDFKKVGINRLSLGIQSFNDTELKYLGREHNSYDSLKALNIGFEIFSKNSFDLIYGLPNQKLVDWEKNLDIAFSYQPKHLSLYQLTIEKGTKFYRKYLEKKLLPISSDKESIFYEFTLNKTKKVGLNNYEISNFSLPKEECVHNLVYWNGGNWLGIGPGAHGRVLLNKNTRLVTENRKNPKSWLECVKLFNNGIEEKRVEDNDEYSLEILLMGLRQKKGIKLNKVIKIINSESLKNLIRSKKVEIQNNYLRSTDEGRKVLDSLLTSLTL